MSKKVVSRYRYLLMRIERKGVNSIRGRHINSGVLSFNY